MIRYLWDGRVQTARVQPVRRGAGRCGDGVDAHRRNARHAERAGAHAVSAGRAAVLPAGRRHPRLLAGDEARARAVRSVDDHRAVAMAGRDAAQRVADAGVCVESARRPRGRAQRPHRRARGAVDHGGGVLAVATANGARDDCFRAGRRDQAAADRARAALLAADPSARRAGRRPRCSCCSTCRSRWPGDPGTPAPRAARGRAERRRAHPLQRSAVPAVRGA